MYWKKIKFAFFVVWIIMSGAILCVLTAPYILSNDAINKIVPQCEWKAKYNKECFMCGMTRAFVYISHGDFIRAREMNKLSLFLFSGFVLNEIFLMFFLLIFIRNKLKTKY